MATEIANLHPYDDVENWVRGDFEKSPWTTEQTLEFQKRLNSAFGADNAIIVTWSGDRRYGDVFLNENGDIERKPVLLFGEIPVNEKDYIYISAPRFCLLEVYHGSQLAASWESASVVKEKDGTLKRIRPDKPPEFFYGHLRVIATHETVVDGYPMCCTRLWRNGKRICYGKYREPDDSDIAFVRRIRENQDRAGVAQRNDASRGAKVLEDAKLSSRHYIDKARLQQAQNTKEFMMAHSGSFFQGILDKIGSTMSPRERDKIVQGALEDQDSERFEKELVG